MVDVLLEQSVVLRSSHPFDILCRNLRPLTELLESEVGERRVDRRTVDMEAEGRSLAIACGERELRRGGDDVALLGVRFKNKIA